MNHYPIGTRYSGSIKYLHFYSQVLKFCFFCVQVQTNQFAQFLNDWNNDNTTASNRDEDDNLNNKHPKIEKSKGSSSIDVDIIKVIQAQIASLTQRDELKKVGRTRPYPLNGTQFPLHQSLSHLRRTHMMARACQINTSITSDHKSIAWYIMMLSWLDYSSTPLRVAFDWLRSLPNGSINSWVDLKT